MANEYRIPKGDISEIAKQYEDVGLEQFKYIGKTLFLFWMKDEFASKFRRMLTIEQFKNSHAGETYRSLLMKEPLEYQTNLFRMMIDHQYIRETDPQAMACLLYTSGKSACTRQTVLNRKFQNQITAAKHSRFCA